MAGIKRNPVLRGVHGNIGEWVFKNYQDKTVVASKPDHIHQPNSPAQLAVREQFRLAAIYGKIVMADPVQKAACKAKATEQKTPVFSFIVAERADPAPIHDGSAERRQRARGQDQLRRPAEIRRPTAGIQVVTKTLDQSEMLIREFLVYGARAVSDIVERVLVLLARTGVPSTQ